MVYQWNKVQLLCLQCRRFNLGLNLFLGALPTWRSASTCSSVFLIDIVYRLPFIFASAGLWWLHVLDCKKSECSKHYCLTWVFTSITKTRQLKWHFSLCILVCLFPQRQKIPDLHSICGLLWCLELFLTQLLYVQLYASMLRFCCWLSLIPNLNYLPRFNSSILSLFSGILFSDHFSSLAR